MKRQFFIAVAFCLVGSQKSIIAGNINGKEVGTLVVGMVLPMSGPQSLYGKEAYEGARLALEDIEAAYPGFSGMIRIEVGDDQSTAAGARIASEELVQKKRASILIGSVSPVSTDAIEEVAKKTGIPHIIPADRTLPAVTSSETVFRSSALERWQGHLLSVFALNHLKVKSASVLLDPKDSLAHDVVETFLRHFEKRGGKVISRVHYHRDKADISGQLSKIIQGKPDVLLLPGSVNADIKEVMSRLKVLSPGLPILGLERWSRSGLMKEVGASWAGHYFVSSFAMNSGSQKVSHFVNRFKKNNKRYPGVLAAMAYDAMILAGDSFRRAETIRPAELVRSMKRTVRADGLSGPFSVSSSGFSEKSGAVMKTISAGSAFQVIVQPEL